MSGATTPEDPSSGPDIRLGVSSCLLGEEVRFDGGHKHDRYLTDTLGRWVRFYPVCPEVEIGLGTPRESIRLVGDVAAPRLVAPRSGADLTGRMNGWSRGKMEEIASWNLHGYVLKKGSPSCGLFRVRVYDEATEMPQRDGRGLFAARLVERFPLLPVEEEGRLHDARLRESFVERLFVHERWQRFLAEDPTPGGLVAFHSRHKLTVMAHHPQLYGELGRLVAEAGTRDFEELVHAYAEGLSTALQRLASRRRHVNVLQHVLGFVKDQLTAGDKEELLGSFEDYRHELVPLVVPITLLKHHLRRHEAPAWVRDQVYLHPYPKELMLRNHV